MIAQLCSGDPTSDTLAELGDLMNDSHASCRDNYECSCEELDAITAMAREAGALGSRLTGAGWGGCAVSLVRENEVDAFLSAVREGYYEARGLEEHIEIAQFASAPSGGVAIYKPE